MSNLGRLNINLHGVAAEFYSLLDTDGLIDYLKRLDHLGFISKSHPGNHHKRWDYICLQLFLVQKLKHSSFNTGLNSKIKILDEEVSNQELLQFFILLANIGHLEGTISSETALLNHIKSNPTVKDEFLSCINKYPFFLPIAQQIISTNDTYKAKYLVSLNYILNRTTNPKIIAALESIVNSYLMSDEKVAKIRNIYFRIRRICFVYLDSHHCHTPLQLNIAKILINIFNYDELFNPVEHDYDKILDASETILTKQIYISPSSSLTYKINQEAFHNFLTKYSIGATKINYSNFIVSLHKGRTEKFELKFPDTEKVWTFQFYLAKDSLKIFDIPVNHDFDNIIVGLLNKETQLQTLLTDKLKKKNAKIVVQYDMRRTLLFLTFILNKQLTTKQVKVVIKNFSFVIHEILTSLNIPSLEFPIDIKTEIRRSFKNDIIRRHFLYLLKMLLERGNNFNLYVKFQYKQEQEKINKGRYKERLYEANYSEKLDDLKATIDLYLTLNLPNDINNNLRLIKHVAINNSKLTGDVAYYYMVLPIEIEERVFDPSDVDKTGNAEVKEVLTDIDAMVLITNKKSFELYIIEGKDMAKGFGPACMADLNKIKSFGQNPDIFSNPVIISGNGTGCKGGYIQVKD